GIGLESRVGVGVPRSVPAVIAILGVMKAGAAYVPLDLAYPPERLSFILLDADVDVIVTSPACADNLPEVGKPAATLEELTLSDGPPPHARASGANAAYVIYTSGSTGVPKGVVVGHASLSRLVEERTAAFAVRAHDRVAQLSSLAFDASVSEIFMALAKGARLDCGSASETHPGPDLLRYLNERRITVVTLPPSSLAVLPREPFPALETIIVAGEACPEELARYWALGRSLFNGYGPTEATVCASLLRCQDRTWPPNVGRPLGGTSLRVLDEELEPAPLGAPGELWIAGDGLARGYHAKADLTSDRFRPDPWGAPGRRMYRTGDRARLLRDGTFQYLGRTDQQVKLRGYRVELGEVRAAMESHPAVGQALVVVRGELANRALVAFWTARTDATTVPTPRELRDAIARRLPAHMVPRILPPLASFPRTPNGKIDVAALTVENDRADGTDAGPSTPIERAVARMMTELLGAGSIGPSDNFFDKGGHSLLATQLASRIRDE